MNKIIEKRQQTERQDRIDKVLAAAMKLFTERGYLDTSVRDIALEARVSTGVIYYYFEGKNDILGRIFEDGFRIMTGMTKKAMRVEGTPLDRVKAMLYVYLELYERYPQYFKIMVFMESGFLRIGLPAETVSKLDEVLTGAWSLVTQELQQAKRKGLLAYEGDIRELTFLLWASLRGTVSMKERGFLDRYQLDINKLLDIQLKLITIA